MNRDEIRKREIRHNNKVRKLGARCPQCIHCGENRPAALISTGSQITCYECRTKEHGRSAIEYHHLAGSNNDSFTIPLPGNDHRFVSDLQTGWPIKTVRNAHNSPFLRIAAALRGTRDLFILWAEYFDSVALVLEDRDRVLEQKFDEKLWERAGVTQLSPKRSTKDD